MTVGQLRRTLESVPDTAMIEIGVGGVLGEIKHHPISVVLASLDLASKASHITLLAGTPPKESKNV